MRKKDSRLSDKQSEFYNCYSMTFHDHRFFEWSSVWMQAKEPICLEDVHSVLEFGTGRNVTKALVEHHGIKHTSVDFNEELFMPDVVETIESYESDEKHDMVCAFQVLEHGPKEELVTRLKKFKRLSNKYVYISVPCSGDGLLC